VFLRKHRRGTTLIEVMISCAIYGAIVLSVFALMKYGTRSWRSVETKNTVQASMRKVMDNMYNELVRTSYSTVILYDSDYRHAICFKSAMNETVDNRATPGLDRKFIILDSSGEPIWQKYVLYYIARPSSLVYHKGISCDGADAASISNPDNKCPHKWLIRKDIILDAGITSAGDLVQFLNEPADKAALVAQKTGNVARVQLIGDNILSFNLRKSEPEIQMTLKAFRELEAGETRTVGNTEIHRSDFTIQVDTRAIPMN
jgi:Tfp pilus assembly protein PilE